MLNVSHSGYYSWLHAQPSPRQVESQRLSTKVKEIFIENRCNYGARRIRKAMNHLSINISRRRVSKLMKRQDLYCKTKKKFRVTTDSAHNFSIAPIYYNGNLMSHALIKPMLVISPTLERKKVGYIWRLSLICFYEKLLAGRCETT